MRLALRIALQAFRAAAAQGVMQNEIERQEAIELIALHFTLADFGEMSFHSLRRQLSFQKLVSRAIASHDADVAGVALIAAAGIGDFRESNAFHAVVVK